MKLVTLGLALFMSLATYAQTDSADTYSSFVKKLEAGDTDIDYKAFRESFFESGQYKTAFGKTKEINELQNKTRSLVKKKNYSEAMQAANQMLGINYTNVVAHQAVAEIATLLGDTAKLNKHLVIIDGLLGSIVSSGDGKTCATAWKVISVDEEYVILTSKGAKVLAQSTTRDGGVCDKMRVTEKGGIKTYYFDITKVMEGYKKVLGY